MAKPQKGKRKAPGQLITDPRFAKVHTDARFQIFPSKQRKVVIDDRFKGGGGCTSFSSNDSSGQELRRSFTAFLINDVVQECSPKSASSIARLWTSEAGRSVGVSLSPAFAHILLPTSPQEACYPPQVKLERKNEDLAQYYRLQGEVLPSMHVCT